MRSSRRTNKSTPKDLGIDQAQQNRRVCGHCISYMLYVEHDFKSPIRRLDCMDFLYQAEPNCRDCIIIAAEIQVITVVFLMGGRLIFARQVLAGLHHSGAQLRGALPQRGGLWLACVGEPVYGSGLGLYLQLSCQSFLSQYLICYQQPNRSNSATQPSPKHVIVISNNAFPCDFICF